MADASTHVTLTVSNGVSVVEFTDRKILEELAIDEIGDELSKIASGGADAKILLNFKNVEHLSSAALGMLITLNRQVAEQNGSLKLSDISPQIFEVFKITRLNKLFDIYDTADEALQSF